MLHVTVTSPPPAGLDSPLRQNEAISTTTTALSSQPSAKLTASVAATTSLVPSEQPRPRALNVVIQEASPVQKPTEAEMSIDITMRGVIPSLLPPYRTEEEMSIVRASGWRPPTDVLEVQRRFTLSSPFIIARDKFKLPDDFAPQLAVWLFAEQEGHPLEPIIRNWLWRDHFTFDIQQTRALKATLTIEFNQVILSIRCEITKIEEVKLFAALVHVCAGRVRRFLGQYAQSSCTIEERAICYRCLSHQTQYSKPCSWIVQPDRDPTNDFDVCIPLPNGGVCPPSTINCQLRPAEVLHPELLLGVYAIEFPNDKILPAYKSLQK
jgi:hypothetical protein